MENTVEAQDKFRKYLCGMTHGFAIGKLPRSQDEDYLKGFNHAQELRRRAVEDAESFYGVKLNPMRLKDSDAA